MTLILDTGPLLAALDRSDPYHAACVALIDRASPPLILPAAILVEVDYFVRTRLSPSNMLVVLDDINSGAYRLEDLQASDVRRVRELMETYADSDIGFVDAAVLAVVERFGETKLATLDQRHFGMLRPRHVEALTLLPE